jgi:glycosyltransferase involved in cell wall biosynthesis
MKIIIIPDNPAAHARHYRIAEALAVKGHEIHFITWDFPRPLTPKKLVHHLLTSMRTSDYRDEAIMMHKIGRLPYFWPHINGWLFKHQVKVIYKNIDADIIFAESFTNETAVPKGLPFIYDLSDDYAAPADVYGSFIYKLAFKMLGVRKTMEKQCRNALAVTAVSDVLCTYAKRYNTNVITLPNGVDTEVIKKVAKDKLTACKNNQSIVYVTGFGLWSRPVEAMQAVVELRKKFPHIELNMIGEGTEVPNIKQFIKDNHAEKFIHYLGFVHDRKKLFSLINKSAVGLNVSEKNKWRDAAHPIKVLEYSALGKKVVSTDLEGVKALGFPNVFIFSDNSKKHNFIKTLETALDTNSEASLKQYKAVSQQVLKEYDWDRLATRLVKLVSSVVRSEKTVRELA